MRMSIACLPAGSSKPGHSTLTDRASPSPSGRRWTSRCSCKVQRSVVVLLRRAAHTRRMWRAGSDFPVGGSKEFGLISAGERGNRGLNAAI